MATLLPAGEVGRPYTFHEAVYIAGAWRDGRGTRREQDRDPYTGEVLVELQLAGLADLDEAYRAAATAGPSLAAAPPHDRSEVLRRAATIMVARRGRDRALARARGWQHADQGDARVGRGARSDRGRRDDAVPGRGRHEARRHPRQGESDLPQARRRRRRDQPVELAAAPHRALGVSGARRRERGRREAGERHADHRRAARRQDPRGGHGARQRSAGQRHPGPTRSAARRTPASAGSMARGRSRRLRPTSG